MTANEFRIGNWILAQTGGEWNYYQVQASDISIWDIEPDVLNEDLVKPITLTVDYLKDAEFSHDRKKSKQTDQDGLWIREGITIYESAWPSGDNNFLYGTYIKGDGSFKGGFTINTVHRLQNLYFAFTNEEIIFKNLLK